METVLIACTLTGLTALTFGTVGGFILGTVGRIFFMHSFRQFIQSNMDQGQEHIDKQIQAAHEQVQTMVTAAHAEATEIYKAAATEALRAGVKNIPRPPSSGLN